MKKSLFTAFAVGLCITAKLMAQVPNYVPTNGLVGWWPFNGNANDESGNGNNGTVNGATLTADRFGNANKAYSFDGVDDFINIVSATTINNISQGPISISCWSYCELFTNNQIIFQFNTTDIIGGGKSYNIYQFPGQKFNFRNWNANNPGFWDLTNQTSFYTNQWYFLTITIQPDINYSEFYVNGVLIGTSSNLIVTLTPPTFLNFGRHHNTSGSFNGKLDDFGIWNRALTECEIQDLYHAQLGSFSNSTVSINPTSSSIGSNATLSVSSPVSSLQWQSNPGNMGWNNVVDNGNYIEATNDTLIVSNLQLSNHNQPFRVLACGDTSNIATIQIADTCITTIYDTLYTTVTDTLIINTTLSLPAPNNENTILIYPNPASDHITIDNGNFSAMAGYTIKIENNAGQQVFQSAINQAQFYVDLSTWTGNGLYFVHLIDPQNNTVTVRKIVLQ